MATQTTERYCPICGKPVADATYDRFGEWACSEGHAEEYVKDARAQRQRQVAGVEAGPPAAPEPRRHGCC